MFISSIRTSFDKYAVFTGTAPRAEFWYFYLFRALVDMVHWVLTIFLITIGFTGGLAALAAGADFATSMGGAIGVIFLIWWLVYTCYSIFIFVPTISSGSRRLHDAGMSGWLQLVILVPVIGVIAYIVLMALPAKSDSAYRSGDSDDMFSSNRSPSQSRPSAFDRPAQNDDDWL